jgi:negative regulator of genetic competence, sporulation and motility
MDILLNKSRDLDKEEIFSAQGLLTIRVTPEELKEIQEELKKLRIKVSNVYDELRSCDEAGCDVGFKDIAQCVDYKSELSDEEVEHEADPVSGVF